MWRRMRPALRGTARHRAAPRCAALRDTAPLHPTVRCRLRPGLSPEDSPRTSAPAGPGPHMARYSPL
ncbi:uncharacterized protein V6R79_018007 [Siganus canaliculatus]